MSELIAAKRMAPADDLLSTLIHVQEDDGDQLNDRELTSLAITILLAGHETTVSLLGQGLFLLLTHTDQLARLR